MASLLGGAQDLPSRRRYRPVEAEVLRARHVSVPLRRRPARGSSRGLHRVGHRCALQADARVQRAAPDGLGRVRLARGAVRDQDRNASEDHDRAQRGAVPRAAQEARFLLRLGSRGQHDRSELLPLDPVDLQAAIRAWARVSRGAPGLVVPGARHHARERGGHRRQIRGRRLPVRPPTVAAMGAQDHRVRRRAARGPRRARLAGQHEGNAAQLDRPQRGRGDRLSDRRLPGSEAARVHDSSRHAVRRHLHGARARARARRWLDAKRAPRRGGGVPRAGRAQERARARRAAEGKNRRLHGCVCDQPRERRENPDLDRRLRARRLRHGRDHGRAGARSTRLGVCKDLRSADHPNRAAAARLRRRGISR